MSIAFNGVEITTTYLANGLKLDQVLVPFCTKPNTGKPSTGKCCMLP